MSANDNDCEFSSIVNFSNEILVVDHIQTKGCKTYYIPAYLRGKLKNIIQMDFQKLMAKVNIDFILEVYYGDLSQQDINHLKSNLVLIFPRDTPVKLQQENQKLVTVKEEKDHCFRYTIRKVIEAEILSNIKWAPFQTADIIISANLRKSKRFVEKSDKAEHWIKYKFNFMDVEGDEFHDLKFSLGTERSFGFYNIAEKQMRVVYDNKYENPNQKDDIEEMGNTINRYDQCFGTCFKSDSKRYRPGDEETDELISYLPPQQLTNEEIQRLKKDEQKKPQKKIDAFQYAYFVLPMYKAPYSMTALVLLQLLLIGAVNVCIFYQDMRLSGKQMLNMAALMVSLVGILPNIRKSMGRSGQITLAEVFTIFQTFTVILTFIHMIQKINISEQKNYFLGEQGLAIVCIIITGLISLILLGCLLVHIFFWRKGYHYFNSKKHQVMWFQRRYWQNDQCDTEFRRSLDYQEGRISMLKPPTAKDKNEKKQEKKDEKNK